MTLTPEIWRHIATYLPLDTLKDLYSVNQTFFHLAMDVRYRDVRFDQINGAVLDRIETLRHPSFASRVRCIYLTPHILHDQAEDGQSSHEGEPQGSKSRIKRLTRRVFGARLPKHHSNEAQLPADSNADDESMNGTQICKNLGEIIPLLVNVHTFYLSWVSSKDYPTLYLDTAWKSFSHTLTKLDLTITTTKALVIFPLPVSFPHLEVLKIHILGRTSIMPCQTTLSSFVNTLHATLKKLAVRSTPVRNLSDFYLGLGHFNTLSCIDVDISTDASFKSSVVPGYTAFIDQQRQVTEELVLYVPPDQSTTWRLEELRLSKLEKLTIHSRLVDNNWDQCTRFMKRHMKKLTDFSTDGRIYPTRLTSFLDVFHHRNPYSLLTTLSFSAAFLDVKLMDLLANGLFRLQSLTVLIDTVSVHAKSTVVPSEFYPRGLVSYHAQASFSNLCLHPNDQTADPAIVRGLRSCDSLKRWELSDITLKRHSCCGDLVLWGLMEVFSQNIPSIKSFMGNGNLTIPNPSNRPPNHLLSSQKGSDGTCRYGRDHTTKLLPPMSCLSLPPEIWHEISGYLTPAALQNAREVNRVFFEIAMNARYQDVSLQRVDDYMVHVLDTLQYSDIAQRVHCLSINPNVYKSDPLCKGRSLSGPLSLALFRRMRRSITEHLLDSKSVEPHICLSSSRVEQRLMAIVPLMTNLTHFTMDWDSFEDLAVPYMDLIWQLHGHRFTHVGIIATTSKIRTMFPLPASLIHVKSLKVVIRKKMDMYNEEREMAQAQLTLSSFVNSLRATLEQLTIACIPMHDLSLLYENLGNFDRLSSLDLNASLPSAPENIFPFQTTMFLQRMGPIIQNLTLSTSLPISPTGSYQFTFADLELHNLRSLTISAEVMALSWEHTLAFLKRHSSSLDSLAIEGPIAPLELSRLLTVVNHTSQNCNITSLSLAVYQVNAEFFAKMARDLYRLKILRLRIRMLASDTSRPITPSQFFPHDPPGENEYPFVKEMKTSHTRSFLDWELNDITIKRRSCCGEIILWGLLRLCAECIPSINSFNANGHTFIPDPANERPKRYDKLWGCNNRLACNYGSDGITVWQN
ncbi:hypothetical protein CVT25_008133 [Psilocybe cyanescens]|uniref:F-box domain-containing protein n=1 Tax=Psilocybe cyanescens TaxID=93625 RepID=A0A409XSG5_PSICY|nr:hypothetical protein CVT25_008133 [Psilocybe cyanescens]